MSQIQKSNISSLKAALESPSIKNKLQEILGKRAATFATSIVQITSQNQMLSGADPNSIIAAAMTAATLNLPINNQIGQAYIVPFNEKQKDGSYLVKAQFILGYKGLKQLATRSGKFRYMNVTDVREGEIDIHNRLSGEMVFNWIENHTERDKRKIVGYVSYFQLVNGFESFYYMTVQDIDKHAKKFSQTYKKGYGNWVDEKEKMSMKTVSKLHLNGGEAPLSLEMQTAIKADQAIMEVDGSGNVIDVESYPDNENVKVDPDEERIMMLINDAKTDEELDFVIPHAGEKYMAAIKNKRKEINSNK